MDFNFQVVILDRNFFNFPREVDVLVQSLKEVLALATASRAPREPLFPSFSLLAYPSDVDEEVVSKGKKGGRKSDSTTKVIPT